MTSGDQFRYALDNLRKTRLRTFLTTFGVVIGIGAMTSMVSVGAGMQRNVMNVFNEENLLTSITVRPGSRDLRPEGIDPDQPERVPTTTDTLRPLDDEAVLLLGGLKGVRVAYPVATVPGLLSMDTISRFVTLEGMPAPVLERDIELERIDLIAGRAYRQDEVSGVVLSRGAADGLLQEGSDPEALVGRRVSFLVARAPTGGEDAGLEQSEFGLPQGFDLPPALQAIPLSGLLRGLPIGALESVRLDLEIVGIVEGASTFGDFLGTAVYVPLEVVGPLYGLAFRDLESLMTGEVRGDSYRQVQVFAEDIVSVEPVQDRISDLGFRSSSIMDDLSELRRAFILVNGFLGIVGGISLFVASMMIVNTLVMAVLERRREIGLLKALGASNGDVTRLFLTEASVIGVLGGLGGLALGWVVAQIANALANLQMARAGDIQVTIIAFPLWLLLGGLAIGIVVSVVAGLYPARRAARVDPVVALRQF
jgi:putative ABC transport system permease protein